MHKVLFPLVLVLILSVTATMSDNTASAQESAPPYGMAGCGLGSVLLGSDDGFIQVFAATTNGTSNTQTFGITSGTSNCVKRGVVRADKEQEMFMEANMANLQRDMAAGGGEYLASFGELLGCQEEAQVQLNQFAQENYAAVFPNESTSPMQALYMFKVQMSQQDRFASSCSKI